MIPWWYMIIALFAGAMFGALVMGLCCANTSGTGRKWWENE